MRHRVQGRTFGRRREPRKALFRGLATSLLDRERIVTTVAKAKELRRFVDPLITLGKDGSLACRRKAASVLYGRSTVTKLFGELAERFKERQGGYTRMFHLGQRRGDGAPMAIIELIPAEKQAKSDPKGKGKVKKAAKASSPAGEKEDTSKKAAKKKAA